MQVQKHSNTCSLADTGVIFKLQDTTILHSPTNPVKKQSYYVVGGGGGERTTLCSSQYIVSI